MEKMMKSTKITIAGLWFLTVLGIFTPLYSQNNTGITGIVYDNQLAEPLPFVHVSLFDSTKSELITGDVSDPDGKYQMNVNSGFAGYLRFSAIGYETIWIEVMTETSGITDLGITGLNFSVTEHEAVVVLGVLPVRSEPGRTSFYMDDEIIRSAVTGTDLLKVIPGIEVDFMQNITVEGSRNIVLLVDGVERDRTFIGQLQSDKIDRIDVVNMPPVGFEADISGAVNIILKKSIDTGFSGHVHGEIPVSSTERYLFPTTSIQYTKNRLNLYSSYSGDFRKFDLSESTLFEGRSDGNFIGGQNLQTLNQLTRSNTIHLGADYFLNSKHRAGFYLLHQNFSQSMDGVSDLKTTGSESVWQTTEKIDRESYKANYYSMSYRFQPNGEFGNELSVNAGLEHRSGSNRVLYRDGNGIESNSSSQLPEEINFRVKADAKTAIRENIQMEYGALYRWRNSEDLNHSDFSYSDRNIAGYSSIHHFSENSGIQAGLRLEKMESNVGNDSGSNSVKLLPAASLYHRFEGSSHRLSLSYRTSVNYPQLYQVNPNLITEDIFSSLRGNPSLVPAVNREVGFEHSFHAGRHFLATRVYTTYTTDSIDLITEKGEQGRMVSQFLNAGNVRRYGVRVSGVIDTGQKSGFHPYLNVYSKKTSLSDELNVRPTSSNPKLMLDSGISASRTFGRDINISMIFQYSTPVYDVQRTNFSGALYFINIDKSFSSGLTIGMTTALTFSKSFLYNGYTIDTEGFYSRSEGTINMSAIPVWLKVNYRFSKGLSKERISHDIERSGRRSGRGF